MAARVASQTLKVLKELKMLETLLIEAGAPMNTSALMSYASAPGLSRPGEAHDEAVAVQA